METSSSYHTHSLVPKILKDIIEAPEGATIEQYRVQSSMHDIVRITYDGQTDFWTMDRMGTIQKRTSWLGKDVHYVKKPESSRTICQWWVDGFLGKLRDEITSWHGNILERK